MILPEVASPIGRAGKPSPLPDNQATGTAFCGWTLCLLVCAERLMLGGLFRAVYA